MVGLADFKPTRVSRRGGGKFEGRLAKLRNGITQLVPESLLS